MPIQSDDGSDRGPARACTAVVFDRSAVDFRTALRSISPVFERNGQQTPHRGVPVPRDVEFPPSPRSRAPPNCYRYFWKPMETLSFFTRPQRAHPARRGGSRLDGPHLLLLALLRRVHHMVGARAPQYRAAPAHLGHGQRARAALVARSLCAPGADLSLTRSGSLRRRAGCICPWHALAASDRAVVSSCHCRSLPSQ